MRHVGMLAAGVLVAMASAASAKRVIMTPTIPRSCPGADSFEKVTACVGKFGKVRVERDLGSAKLISLGSDHFRAPGLYIYALRGKKWVLSGMYETSSTFDIEAFERVTLAKHTGYRFDIGLVEPVNLDPERSVATADVVQQKLSVFCAGTSYSCTAVRTSCDLFVDGTSRESFRGKLTFKGDVVTVVGDRTLDGHFGYCAVANELNLDFSEGGDFEPMLKQLPELDQ